MNFEVKLQAFLDNCVAKAQDGLTMQELFSLLLEFVEFAVEAAKELSNPGAEKREFVLAWVGKLFDLIAPKVPVPIWYLPFQPFVRPINRRLILALAGALIEWNLKG